MDPFCKLPPCVKYSAKIFQHSNFFFEISLWNILRPKYPKACKNQISLPIGGNSVFAREPMPTSIDFIPCSKTSAFCQHPPPSPQKILEISWKKSKSGSATSHQIRPSAAERPRSIPSCYAANSDLFFCGTGAEKSEGRVCGCLRGLYVVHFGSTGRGGEVRLQALMELCSSLPRSQDLLALQGVEQLRTMGRRLQRPSMKDNS